ncbi:hypothetical protein MYSTI_07308 [Myxococcus stipitatus DSM 14675]|uniref:Lipoprotein n=1 Tax=Myxococcus stipitatus (strain DSM 14675 / JCM 12634 / Mx s8) TaxID=1278073 RepID=L7UL06_MYXSD|nr:hypothetical protein [Myxococcus stipitatus]AGC48580.1 hypothetical protein MYSTI_07308 [Myxococcus stipitatus DSM 14675]
MRNPVVTSLLVMLSLAACGSDSPRPPPPNFCPERPVYMAPRGPGQLMTRSRPLPSAFLARRASLPLLAAARTRDTAEPTEWGGSWWASPCLMGTPGLEVATPRVGVAVDGRALSVWMEWDGIDEWLWFSEFVPQTGWTPSERMKLQRDFPDDPIRVRQPQVVADADGRMLALWLQSEGSRAAELWFAEHLPGEGWRPPARVLTQPLGDVTFLQAARDGAGVLTLAWTQFDGDTLSENVWATRGAPSTGWDAARRIDTPVPGFSVEPQLSVSSDGHVLVGWYRFDEMEGWSGAWFSRWSYTEGWSAAERLSPEGLESFFVEPLAGPGGSALAMWSEGGVANVSLWARRYVPGTGWGAAEKVEEALGSSAMAQASAEKDGRAMVVWPRARSGIIRLSARPYDFTLGWRERVDVDPSPLGGVTDPQVVSLSRTQALVVWTREKDGQFRVGSSRYTPGQGWGRTAWLDTVPSSQNGFPQLSVNATGVGVATWLHGGEVPGVGLSVFQ